MINKTTQIYLREYEQKSIQAFLDSSSKILHIFGNPGTGKTCVTLFVLNTKKYTYFNYLENTTFYKQKKTEGIIVIDEFDRFYEYKKKEASRFLSKPGKKIITLANKCIFSNSLQFKSYTTEELVFILTKLNNHLTEENIKLIAKKFHGQGDVRRALEYCNGMFDRGHSIDGELNINHRMVKDMARLCVARDEVYSVYVEHCKENVVPYMGRCDFFSIYEMYL